MVSIATLSIVVFTLGVLAFTAGVFWISLDDAHSPWALQGEGDEDGG